MMGNIKDSLSKRLIGQEGIPIPLGHCYFSTSFLFFIPFAYYGECLFYGNEVEYKLAQDYFKWMMLFGPSFPLYSALCGFFVGRGKTTLITVLAILANGINALLNYILIFGIEGWIPSYGPRGSVIATSGSTIFQALVLFIVFLSEKNRREFGSGFFGFKPLAFWRSIKVGFPNAMFVGIEILGFAVYYAMMTLMGEKYITIAGICQSVIILLYFFADGISKAATTVAGNLIGAQKQTLIPQVFFAGVKMHVIFFFIMLGAFYLFSDGLLRAFLPNAPPELYKEYYNALAIGLFCMIFYMFFEGVRLLLTGLLTAAGDTLFLLYAGSLSVWIFLVLPIYLIVVLGQTPVEVSSLLCVVYSFVACAIYFWRFQSGKWQHIKILGS